MKYIFEIVHKKMGWPKKAIGEAVNENTAREKMNDSFIKSGFEKKTLDSWILVEIIDEVNKIKIFLCTSLK